jgi:hypothetical protein
MVVWSTLSQRRWIDIKQSLSGYVALFANPRNDELIILALSS